MSTDYIKAIVMAVIFCLLPLKGTAQNYDRTEYCPLTEGLSLKYVNYDNKGKVTGYFILEVTSAKGNVANGELMFSQSFFNAEDEPVFSDNNTPMKVITKDGITSSYMSGVGRILKIQDDISKGDASSVPSDVTVGSTIPDGEIRVHIDKISATIRTTNRKVTEQKEITTPAGTFNSILLKEDQITKTLGSKEEKIETWYAKGLGAVRQFIYNRKGHLVRSQELISVSVRK